jgi:hypothetical protein
MTFKRLEKNISRRGAEEAETAKRLRLWRSRSHAFSNVQISSSAAIMSLRLGKISLWPLLPLRLCAKQKFGVSA